MSRFSRTSFATLACAALIAGQAGPAWAELGVTAADYEACKAEDEGAFRRAIEAVTSKALTEELRGVDYEAAVAIEWRRLGIDQIVDKRVDDAVAEVRDAESWGGLLKSLGSQEKAQELATAVAERVYQSAEMRKAIEDLATAVGTEAGKRIEIASQDAAGPALTCLKTFLGPRYGSTVAAAVTGDVGREYGFDTGKGGAEISAGSVLKQSGGGVAGATVLILRRQLANMAQRLGQRLAGSVLSRLVSVAAGGVGLVLIAKDIWDLRHGVLPIIADEMKSADMKGKVRAELAKTLAEEINLNLKDIAAKSSDRVLEVWQEFRRAHAKAIDLAGRDAAFKTFLDSVTPSQFARLDEVLSLLLADEGEAGILKRVADGTLSVAVNQLPEPALTIARETGSISAALSWSAVAGSDLAAVVDYEIYQRAKPEDFSDASLRRLLRVGERLPIVRLSGVSRGAREALLELDSDRLKSLATGLDTPALETFASYLTDLQKAPRERMLEAVAADPGQMKALASQRVRKAVVASADQEAAVDMMLRPPAQSFDVIARDFEAAWQGRISPVLLWDKHPLLIIAVAVAALFLLLWLWRLFRPARMRPPPAAPQTS